MTCVFCMSPLFCNSKYGEFRTRRRLADLPTKSRLKMSEVHKSKSERRGGSKKQKKTKKQRRVGHKMGILEHVRQVRTRGAAQRSTESKGSWGEHKTVETGCLVRGKTSSVPKCHPSWQVQIDTLFPATSKQKKPKPKQKIEGNSTCCGSSGQASSLPFSQVVFK